MARLKRPANKNKMESCSSSSQKSGTKSSSSTSSKSLSNRENEIEVQSNPSNTPQTNQPTLETTPAPQSPPPTMVQISEVLIGAIPITCKTVIEPIQCSQTAAEIKTTTPKIKTNPISKKTSTSNKTKKSKSLDVSKVRKSSRLASGAGRRPAIDKTVYSLSDDDSENTHSGSPKAKSVPEIKTYSKRPSSSKHHSKPSKSESSEEDIMIRKLKKPAPLIHEDCQQSFEIFSKKKPVLPGRVYNFDDLINTDHDLTQYTNPLGWTNLFNIRETHYPNLISAFYFNAVISSEQTYIASELKGIKFKVTEQLLSELLDVPSSGHKLYGESWFSMAGVNKETFMT
ncbi:unnamed protein product [Trifolium pratense]|uniref:Uncharacterized protein n=1 Tax=Trifolium pratense TaxID=57577 RepID=A0ACB0K6A6_TRIPR|nr:unnamed protein product [Trifolium pratense]